MLRLVMYIDSKGYKHEDKGIRWTNGNHRFWLKYSRFISDYGGEDIKFPMMIHFPNHTDERWDLAKHLKLPKFS